MLFIQLVFGLSVIISIFLLLLFLKKEDYERNIQDVKLIILLALVGIAGIVVPMKAVVILVVFLITLLIGKRTGMM